MGKLFTNTVMNISSRIWEEQATFHSILSSVDNDAPLITADVLNHYDLWL